MILFEYEDPSLNGDNTVRGFIKLKKDPKG